MRAYLEAITKKEQFKSQKAALFIQGIEVNHMPTEAKKIENTSKHWTKSEKARRESAEMALERKYVKLTRPKRVTEDAVSSAYWKTTIERMKGITLLDNVDIDLLAAYCMAQSKADDLRSDLAKNRARTEATISRTLQKVIDGEYVDNDYPAQVIRSILMNEVAILKTLQGQERLVISYQKELGLTPNARQRLAKKKAEERPVTAEDLLYGD